MGSVGWAEARGDCIATGRLALLSRMQSAWWCLAAPTLGAAPLCSARHAAGRLWLCHHLFSWLSRAVCLSVCHHPHSSPKSLLEPEKEAWKVGWELESQQKVASDPVSSPFVR